jgi:uncharacterized membrane protein YwaF
MWSIWHILYIISPFVIFLAIHFLMINHTDKAINTVGYIFGSISILILMVRNVDIFARSGWNVEVIPLQVCHIGSIISGLALLFKRHWLILTAFCFNTIPALLAMVFADSLANYDTIFKIRAQAYIWGHILIVVCALYALLLYRPKFSKYDLYKSMGFVGGMSLIAILCNSLFRATFNWTPNYFYLFDYKGTPLKFLYNAFPASRYGWFEINWFYSGVLLVVFIGVFVGMYFLAKLLVKTALKHD